MRRNDSQEILKLLDISERHGYMADELNLLFELIPRIANNQSTDINFLLSKGKR